MLHWPGWWWIWIWVFYLYGGTTKYLEPVKPLPHASPNTRLQCHPVNRVEVAVVSGLFPIDSPPHCPTIRGIEKPLKGHLLIDLFQLFQFRIKDRRIKATRQLRPRSPELGWHRQPGSPTWGRLGAGSKSNFA
jgi:hypothetical protein